MLNTDTQMIDEKYMRRALEIARGGELYAHPNPMVGAVIVDQEGRIIGEGYHRRCGEPHAEVNAIAAVRDRNRLRDSTIYVTLEPCAHYGRTGPCSKLIIDTGIPRVVVGARDPFSKVDGRGITMMREAGIDVTVGLLEQECRSLNAAFFTAHTHHRPFITLKWAQTADGFIAPGRISTDATQVLVHHLRAMNDAILIGSGTYIADRPSLENRLWGGPSPRRIVLDRRGRLPQSDRFDIITDCKPIPEIMSDLYADGITSLLVEGGAEIHRAFLAAGLWDVIRVETSPRLAGTSGLVVAPDIAGLVPAKFMQIDGNTIAYFTQNPIADVKNL